MTCTSHMYIYYIVDIDQDQMKLVYYVAGKQSALRNSVTN